MRKDKIGSTWLPKVNSLIRINNLIYDSINLNLNDKQNLITTITDNRPWNPYYGFVYDALIEILDENR
jgi:hypothetical protein